MTHKSRIWRCIDNHLLPRESCKIDVKLSCGSIFIGCNIYVSDYCIMVAFKDYWLNIMDITKWRHAK